MNIKFKWVVLTALFVLCLGVLFISQQLVETKENRQLVGRTQARLSKRMTEFATALIVISATQMVCVCVLLTLFQKNELGIQTEEVSQALEGLDVSRILRKREVLSQSEMLALMKNLAQELREAKTIQEYLIDRASHVVCLVDHKGRFLSVSRASLTAWGYLGKDLEGRSVADIVVEGNELLKTLMAVANTTQRAVVETKLRCRDDELLEVIWTGYWSSSDAALFCVIQDVTSRKRAEDQLRQILDALPAGVLIAGAWPPVIEFANGQACRLLRCDRGQLNSHALSDVWQYGFKQSTTDGAESDEIFQTIAMRPDGTRFPVEVSTRSIEMADEVKQLFVFLDISTQQETERLKSEFLAMVTHDLRSPLASLQGMLVLLDKGILGELTEQGHRLSGKMSRDFERLNRLINDMLDLEKIQQGKLQLELAEVQMFDMIDQAMEVMRLHAIAKSIQMTRTGAVTTNCWGDRDQLVRVLVNLLSNALKYSPEGSEIEVLIEDLGTHARVAVVDQGRGIPVDKLERIFDKFEQTEIADAKKSGGTGLGLAICKAIVEEHGGQIGAMNNIVNRGGSTFWFTVPKVWSAEQQAAAAAETHRDIAVRPDGGRGDVQAS